MLRLYLALGIGSAAVAAFFWVRMDAADDREKQLRSESTETVLIHIREDMQNDAEIERKSDADLRGDFVKWVRETGPH